MKEKRKSNEKRKEKSRDAARYRRSKETDIFTEFSAALPIPPNEAAHLDKASIMRLAIAYLKVRSLIGAVPDEPIDKSSSPEMDELVLKALDGFMLVLSGNGDMIYLSENVNDYLGITQMDLMGQSVFEYSHPCDHDEIRECLSLKQTNGNDEKNPCNFFLRLKCTLTNKGRKVNLKSASYKVLHCTGHLLTNNIKSTSEWESKEDEENAQKEMSTSLVIMACPVPHPSNIEVPLGRYTFLTKHNLNMKFTYADDKLTEFLGWDSNELVGQSIFEYLHALDNESLDKSFKSLFSKGQCETMVYRFLGKKGGYAWVVTQATLIYCSRQQKPLSVVCVNYIISGIECENEVYNLRQLEARNSSLKSELTIEESTRKTLISPPLQSLQEAVPLRKVEARNQNTDKRRSDEDKENDAHLLRAVPRNPVSEPDSRISPYTLLTDQEELLPQQPETRSPPQTATASIFAPRTKDMNKGFLTFSEDQPGLTMLKDEPEDLTHLAPTAGDVCVPLEDTPFLSDMLDEFILNSNYCPLLSPDLPSELPGSDLGESPLKDAEQTILGDPLRGATIDPLSDKDPFFYRDSSSRCSISTDLHSPTLSKSPDRSGDSLCSPHGSGGGLSEDEMLMLNISDVMADDELALRAPYIPMSDQDEALQMLISDDMVMWGPMQFDKKSKWLTDSSEENTNSSLAQLLTNGNSNSQRCTDHGGGLVNPAQVLGQISIKNAIKDNTAEYQRSNKRVHTMPARQQTDCKRFKCESGGLSNLEEMLSQSVQGSQLLQQLVSQQVPTSNSRRWQGNAGDSPRSDGIYSDRSGRSSVLTGEDDGGGSSRLGYLRDDDDSGGGPKPSPTGSQQSNSVLMNLLVSGCDDIDYSQRMVPIPQYMSPQETSPHTARLKSLEVTDWISRTEPLNQISPVPKQQFDNSRSINRNKMDIGATSFDNLAYEPVRFDDSGIMQENYLYRMLDQTLV